MYMPSGHSAIAGVQHVIGDKRFWPIVILGAIIAGVVGIAIWAALTGEANPDTIPAYPFPLYYL